MFLYLIIFVFIRKNRVNLEVNDDNNNNNNNNNNKGNFICVFEYAIVNLATYRQFTNAAWDWIIKKKKTNKQTNKKNQNCIKSGLSQFLFLQQKM